MASIYRTSLLRSASVLSSSPRLISQSTLKTFRPASTTLLKFTQAQKPSITARIAPFSTSAHYKILPPGPQVIQGGVNDPAPVPAPNPTHGSYHWTFERALSVALVPLVITPFAAGAVSPTIDALLIAATLLHSHIGFEACIIDYLPVWQVPTARKILLWVLNICTVLVGIGYYQFETNDVGVTEAIKRTWHAGANDATIGKANPANLSNLGHDGQLKHLKS